MAENQEKKVVEEVVETTEEKVEQPQEEKVEETKEESKNEILDDGTVKVDLRNYSEETTKEPVEETVEEKVEEQPVEEVVQEVVQEEKEEEVVEEQPVLEEVTEEVTEQAEELQEEVEQAIGEAQETGQQLPDNIQKVVDFMNETGGSLEDYVQLNKDYSKMSDNDLLSEYFKQTKPHLTEEDRVFMMEDMYSYDEDSDDEKEIRRKKLALKEQVANARSHLDGQKSKYYNEVKAGSRLNPEQQKAVDFFNRYNKNLEQTEVDKSVFQKKTNEVFTDKFKGFEYNVGEKRYRLNIKDVNKVKDTQSDINNFVSKFLNKKTQQMDNAGGYHKSLFTAMNPDLVANHFYQQGKSDALKESMAKSKNVDMSPRGTHSNEIPTGGIKVRAIPGNTSNDFKVKIRNFNKKQ
jgi:hypothetical protein